MSYTSADGESHFRRTEPNDASKSVQLYYREAEDENPHSYKAASVCSYPDVTHPSVDEILRREPSNAC
jgi:hypothetical protein